MSLPLPPSRSVAQSHSGAESVYLTLAGSYLGPKRVRPSKSSSLVGAFQAVVAQLPPWYLPEIAWLSADTLRECGVNKLTDPYRCPDRLSTDSFLLPDSAFAVPLFISSVTSEEIGTYQQLPSSSLRYPPLPVLILPSSWPASLHPS